MVPKTTEKKPVYNDINQQLTLINRHYSGIIQLDFCTFSLAIDLKKLIIFDEQTL